MSYASTVLAEGTSKYSTGTSTLSTTMQWMQIMASRPSTLKHDIGAQNDLHHTEVSKGHVL